MNLIITPVYKAFEALQNCCDALDTRTVNPFFHVILADNSGVVPPIPIKENRIIIGLNNDVDPKQHEMQLGRLIDAGLGFAFGNLDFQYFFYIESDVFMYHDWDFRMLEIVKTLPDNWGTLDILSVDKAGNTTYPATIHHRIASISEQGLLDELEYPDFQCTLFSPSFVERLRKKEFAFKEFASHNDIMTGHAMTERWGYRHFRTRQVKAYHEGGVDRALRSLERDEKPNKEGY
jgi:hypothetical protein